MVVVFHLPSQGDNRPAQLDIGLIVSIWKGVKDPKIYSGEVPVSGCMAFRALSLEMVLEDSLHSL